MSKATKTEAGATAPPPVRTSRPARYYTWAELMRRVFNVDVRHHRPVGISHANLRRDDAYHTVPHNLIFVQAEETMRRLLNPEHLAYGDATDLSNNPTTTSVQSRDLPPLAGPSGGLGATARRADHGPPRRT